MTALRRTVGDLLRSRDYEGVLALAKREHRLVRTVVSLLYDGDELIRWRAVTMMGRLAGAEPAKVRPLISRFVWWMNDESGGIGWSSAPALGEIGRMAPALLSDTVRVVVFYRQEPVLLKGVLWAIGRLAATYAAVVEEAVPDVIGFLGDPASEIRGQAAWTLGETGDPRAREGLAGLRKDRNRVLLYEEEELVVKETKTISAEALAKIPAG